MKEGFQVSQTLGVTLEPLPNTPVGSLKLLSYMPEGIARKLLSKGFQKAHKGLKGQPFYGSTLQSIKRGKPTEIDYLNGEIVRLGKEHNVSTPYNERIVELVHEVEKTGHFINLNDTMKRIKG